MQISWKHIRTLNGSQPEGFEEFCTQFARRETMPSGSRFSRKGKPDAGIECFWTLPSGDEWAWQAKFFLSVDLKQWSQIDESVKTALEKHPRIVRYYVCAPIDLPDARLDGQTSAYRRWTERVVKWTGWATERGMTVEFLWWGSSELLERLSSPKNAGLMRFWFDGAALTPDWFTKRLDEAVTTAGPRYTPEVNVELPIVQEFDAFGRTSAWIRRLKQYAAEMRKTVRIASNGVDKLGSECGAYEQILAEFEPVITGIREITVAPTSPVSFAPLLDAMEAARNAIQTVATLLRTSEHKGEPKSDGGSSSAYIENPYRAARSRILAVDRVLAEAIQTFRHTQQFASSRILVLDGSAGMGKTHFLCDLARSRHSLNLPTILLMGQRFLQAAEPWPQALQQLDLSRWTAEEFIGALETAAEAADAKALLMIDALNEGAGRDIWPNNMGAFLALATQSPWISVVVSVRTNYEELVLPEEVSEAASRVTHVGFEEHEYDASKTFFRFYGIELPSTPLLAPEYRSPLFLKSICVGLKDEGHTRLPRGFHGISQVFRLYTDAINKRLANTLKFDPRSHLVQKALQQIVSAFPSPRKQWLPRAQAKALIDAILPSQNFQNSLYQGLVAEGLLVEDFVRPDDGEEQEFVHLGYERLADHFTAQTMLNAASRRNEGAESDETVLFDQVGRLSSGVLESLFIQAPEILGQELQDYASTVLSHWRWRSAYRQSLVWRSPGAFTERTRHWFNQSITSDSDDLDALDVVLTLASVPDHPWNADFLDHQLRKRVMADRDVWWSMKLHSLYSERRSAVHRIIDWALHLSSSDVVDRESVRLVSTVLGWMFSSSHRFLRDRATKATVNLLAGQEAVAAEFVQKFSSVDDRYIYERVMAVAYGVVMRTQDTARIRSVADAVLTTVFDKVPIAPHFLLRDYARGVIERLHSLEEQPIAVMERVRPPYGSKWPVIPSKRTIDRLDQSLEKEGKDGWAARQITFSVMHDDFGRYVIGTNSWSTDWLSLRLTEPRWLSYDDRVRGFRAKLDPLLQSAWDLYEDAENACSRIRSSMLFAEMRASITAGKGKQSDKLDTSLQQAQLTLQKTQRILLDLLEPDQADELNEIWKSRKTSTRDQPPRFDLTLIQRYVIRRVFAMGWTTERFGHFDSYVVTKTNRDASKPERMGKKYQWIAYHEICAFVADNFQFRNDIGLDACEATYMGPWQDSFRDIDPSHSLLGTGGDSDSEVGWWAPQFEPDWGQEQEGLSWSESVDDFPDVSLLLKKKDGDGRAWLLADVTFNRERPIPEGMDRDEVEKRSYWCHLRSFLVREQDVDDFMNWAKGVDFFGQWMPQVPSSHAMFLGEYVWSPAWRHFNHSYYENEGWVKPDRGCPVNVRPTALEYHQGSSGFDCSIDSGFTLHLPDTELVKAMGLHWNGYGSEFINAGGDVITKDPSVSDRGPAALVVREDAVEHMVHATDLRVCWMIVGEKHAYLPGPVKRLGAIHISGACTYEDGQFRGFLNFIKDDAGHDQRIGTVLAQKQL